MRSRFRLRRPTVTIWIYVFFLKMVCMFESVLAMIVTRKNEQTMINRAGARNKENGGMS